MQQITIACKTITIKLMIEMARAKRDSYFYSCKVISTFSFYSLPALLSISSMYALDMLTMIRFEKI